MTLADYRVQTRSGGFPLIGVLSMLALIMAIVLLGMELIAYSEQADSLGTDVTIGGVQVGGLNESQRVARLESVYVEQPVTLRYNGNPILLYPSEVGFRLDTDAMQAAAARQGSTDDNFWAGFWNFLWNRPKPAIRVELRAEYSRVELRQFLQDIANRYDAPQEGPGFDMATLTFNRSTTNTRLDIEAATPLIDAALFESASEARFIELPTVEVAGQDATMDTLRQAIINYMDSRGVFYNGDTQTVSMFVMDLQTGEEMGIQENVPHSAVSTIKLPVLINFFRDRITAPNDDEKFLLASSVICSTNSATNQLMFLTSDDGSYVDGPRNVTQTMCEAGAVNTQLRSNLFNGTPEELERSGFNPTEYYATVAETPCPTVGPQASQSARPYADPINRTTAGDMGTLLMLTYDCAMHGSGLRTVFPDEITQTECQQILEIMSGTRFERFTELGTPQEVRIAHKVGYNDETVADVGIVFSPGGDYVFVIYVWEEDLDFNGLTNLSTWDLIGDVARIVYNYFNPDTPLLQTRRPVNPAGGAACVLPYNGSEINLNDIDANRFDENGNPLPTACYDYPDCRPFDGWGSDPR